LNTADRLLKPLSAVRDFLESEAAGGVILMLAAILAMVLANGPMAEAFTALLNHPIGPVLTDKLGPMTAVLWINDGLMAVFFFLVGLEIKRELLDGQLANPADRRLPFIAATAGVALPAMIFLFFTRNAPNVQNGWAIPAATDIAFAIGVLALLGKRVPAALKLFLLTVAIVDDMMAVGIIAFFYTPSIKLGWLLAAAVVLGLMFAMNRAKIVRIAPYVFLAMLLWFLVLQSGVHATVAGVLAALTIPVVVTPAAPDAVNSPLHRLEHAIHPWSAYLIVPLFGLANAGVDMRGLTLDVLLAPLTMGIMLGLFLGKQIGIFAAVWIAVRLRIAPIPAKANWVQVYGVATLCGIGFTMSLFIGSLAFPVSSEDGPLLQEQAKLGILAGSLISGMAGALILKYAPRNNT
jgi:Na+:H+ antiporter, NhaA family